MNGTLEYCLLVSVMNEVKLKSNDVGNQTGFECRYVYERILIIVSMHISE